MFGCKKVQEKLWFDSKDQIDCKLKITRPRLTATCMDVINN